MRLLFVLGWLVAWQARAQAVVAVLDAQGVPDALPPRAQRAGEAAFTALSAWDVTVAPAFKKGAPKKCTDDCAAQLAKRSGPLALLLDLKGAEPQKGDKGPPDRLSVELSLWEDGVELGRKKVDTSSDGLEASLKPALDALLPTYARRGFGGLQLPDDASLTVKVGGRALKGRPGALVGLPAGSHLVDVVFPDDRAVLRRLEVAEGARVKVDATPPPKPVLTQKAPGASFSALRGASYAVFMAGALSLASGFIVGALARSTVAPLKPCSSTSDACATLDDVNLARAQADSLVTTGNVLLGVGYGLAALGVGLFVLDVALE